MDIILGGLSMSKDNSDFFKQKNSWSLIKDRLLSGYLAPYMQKVLTTNKKICYVDCFSGKGKFDDGQPGSPLIALKIRDDCLSKTKIKVNKQCAIDMTFIELNYAPDLEINLAQYDNYYGKPHIVSGKYEEKIVEILKDKRGQNVFLYIDPYGIKALDTGLFDQFQTMGFNTFEMLINFNTFGFFRDACRVMSVDYKHDDALQGLDDLVEYDPSSVIGFDKPAEKLTSIAGGEYWKAIVQDYKAGYINGYQAEQRFSTEYKQRLKQRYGYVLDMPIKLKSGSRPKYRMIHVSDHEDGCYLMAQNMQNRKDELYTNIQSGGQMSLFDFMDSISQSVEGEWIRQEDIEKYVKDTVKKIDKELGITKFLAAFVNEYGLICDFKRIQNILAELEKKKEIVIERYPDKTEKGRVSTFWEEKGEKRVIIRRLKE